jgi:hypothetical protein
MVVDSIPAPAKKRRRTKPAAEVVRAAPPRPVKAAKPRPGALVRAIQAGFLVSGLGAVVMLTSILLADQAPSWRSLSVVMLQALPLMPGIALLLWLIEAGRRRFPSVPLALWMGLAIIGAALVMLAFPGLTFAIHSRATVLSEEHEFPVTLEHHMWGVMGAFYVYMATAFRLWWPAGLILPALVAILVWRQPRPN